MHDKPPNSLFWTKSHLQRQFLPYQNEVSLTKFDSNWCHSMSMKIKKKLQTSEKWYLLFDSFVLVSHYRLFEIKLFKNNIITDLFLSNFDEKQDKKSSSSHGDDLKLTTTFQKSLAPIFLTFRDFPENSIPLLRILFQF